MQSDHFSAVSVGTWFFQYMEGLSVCSFSGDVVLIIQRHMNVYP